MIGLSADTLLNGEIISKDSVPLYPVSAVCAEVEKSLVNGSIYIFGISDLSNDTIFRYNINHANGNYFFIGSFHPTPDLCGKFTATGYVLNPDTIWFKPHSFVIYKP